MKTMTRITVSLLIIFLFLAFKPFLGASFATNTCDVVSIIFEPSTDKIDANTWFRTSNIPTFKVSIKGNGFCGGVTLPDVALVNVIYNNTDIDALNDVPVTFNDNSNEIIFTFTAGQEGCQADLGRNDCQLELYVKTSFGPFFSKTLSGRNGELSYECDDRFYTCDNSIKYKLDRVTGGSLTSSSIIWACVADNGIYSCSDANDKNFSDTNNSACKGKNPIQIDPLKCGQTADIIGDGDCGGTGQPACTVIPSTATQSYNFSIDNPLAGGPNDLFDIINIVTQWIMYISVPLAVLLIMYAGFLMLTAGPFPDHFQKGRDILKYTVLGLAIIFIGKGFVSLIISVIELGGGTGTTPPTTQEGGLPGNACGQQPSDCKPGLACNNGVCQYPEGNGVGYPCISGASNCAANLACDDSAGMCQQVDGTSRPCAQTIDGRAMGTCVAR